MNYFGSATSLVVKILSDAAAKMCGGISDRYRGEFVSLTKEVVGQDVDADLHESHEFDNHATTGRDLPGATPGEAIGHPPGDMPDLSHMPPIGDVVDAGRAGADKATLTRMMKGLERQYGPYRLGKLFARYTNNTLSTLKWGPENTLARKLPARVSMTAKIMREDGVRAGYVIYHFFRDADSKLVVENAWTMIRPKFRRKGFSSAFFKATEDYFRKSGVDRMQIRATRDGGYTWARAGYEWDPDTLLLRLSVENMQKRIDGVIADTPNLSDADRALLQDAKARFQGPIAGYLSPSEMASLAGDDPNLGERIMRGSRWFGIKKL